MTSETLLNLINRVVKSRAEYQYIELKAARDGAPKRLYDSLSSFSNSDEGGIIIFGIDEENDFESTGLNSPFDTLNIGLYNLFSVALT